ncbi:MAG: sigma-70 family RNA polymerase sigma factor [candidate division Zixibacteria bacterium]|nr:sigma-70 family RNA polymerase sigma factor [candidate division Zixibacteria bacterium]
MEKANNETITRLVDQAQHGDQEAFSELVRLKMNDIVALTYRMTGDRETAKDLAQETFITAWEKLSSFRGESAFGSWLYRIATNKTLNLLNRPSSHETQLEIEPTTSSTPESQLARKELQNDIREFMLQLPPGQRVVFDLRFYKQLTFDEISQTTGRAVGTVKTHYRQAVIKLRQWAVEKGWRS